MKKAAFLVIFAALCLFAAPHERAESGPWGLGFRSSVDFGSMGIEEDAIVTYKDSLYMGLDLVTSPKVFFMLFPGSLTSDGLTRSWTYNIDLEPRLEAGYLYRPWSWLSLRSGLDASLIMNFVKYHLSNTDYGIDIPDFQNAYYIFEPALFFSADLDYGTWLRAKALRGWDLRLGIRVPLRDIYYDYERYRVIVSLGWEY
jgi:hypothetical protein